MLFVLLGVEDEGEDGGSAVRVSSGSSRALLAAGGEVGGDLMGSLTGEEVIVRLTVEAVK